MAFLSLLHQTKGTDGERKIKGGGGGGQGEREVYTIIYRVFLPDVELSRFFNFSNIHNLPLKKPPLGRLLLHCCFTSTEARWLIRDRDRVGRGRQSEGLTTETAPKRPESPCCQNNGSIKAVSPHHCPATCALRNCCFNCCAWTVTKTMSIALLLTNNLDNSKQKRSNLLSPAPPPYSWSLLG